MSDEAWWYVRMCSPDVQVDYDVQFDYVVFACAEMFTLYCLSYARGTILQLPVCSLYDLVVTARGVGDALRVSVTQLSYR